MKKFKNSTYVISMISMVFIIDTVLLISIFLLENIVYTIAMTIYIFLTILVTFLSYKFILSKVVINEKEIKVMVIKKCVKSIEWEDITNIKYEYNVGLKSKYLFLKSKNDKISFNAGIKTIKNLINISPGEKKGLLEKLLPDNQN